MGSLSLIVAGQAGGPGAGREHGKIEMLLAENEIVTGGGRSCRAGGEHGMMLCNRDTSGQFVSL